MTAGLGRLPVSPGRTRPPCCVGHSSPTRGDPSRGLAAIATHWGTEATGHARPETQGPSVEVLGTVEQRRTALCAFLNSQSTLPMGIVASSSVKQPRFTNEKTREEKVGGGRGQAPPWDEQSSREYYRDGNSPSRRSGGGPSHVNAGCPPAKGRSPPKLCKQIFWTNSEQWHIY